MKDFEYNIGFNFLYYQERSGELADKGQAFCSPVCCFGDTDHVPAYAKEGKPISGFYPYRTVAVSFQTDAEAENYVNQDGKRLQPNAKAGDIRFVDVMETAPLDEDDKAYCGTGIPKWKPTWTFPALIGVSTSHSA